MPHPPMVSATNLWQAMACNFCHARLSHQQPGFTQAVFMFGARLIRN
jgi:hypothetical protein